MSIMYSEYTDKMTDTDYIEVFELNNGDIIPLDDDESLFDAYQQGLISRDDMINELDFTHEQLGIKLENDYLMNKRKESE